MIDGQGREWYAGDNGEWRDIGCVDVHDLHVDPTVQRDLIESTWTSVRDNLDDRLLEAPTVSQRDDGKLWVMEGQNRVHGLQQRFVVGERSIWVIRVNASDARDEADVAVRISRGRKPHSPYDRWGLELNRGNADVVALQQVLTRHGYHVGRRRGQGVVSCPSLLFKWAGNAERLDNVLTAVSDMQDGAGMPPGATVTRPILDAVDLIFRVNPDHVDMRRLRDRLSERAADGAGSWLSAARGMNAARTSIANEMIDAYNKGLPINGPKRLAHA